MNLWVVNGTGTTDGGTNGLGRGRCASGSGEGERLAPDSYNWRAGDTIVAFSTVPATACSRRRAEVTFGSGRAY